MTKTWITKVGYPAKLNKVHFGRPYFCGYVQVPQDHPLHGVKYGEQSPLLSLPENSTLGKRGIIPSIIFCTANKEHATTLANLPPDVYFNVHGSITFSGQLRDEQGFWYGFDCNHLHDSIEEQDETYCTQECENLAEQLFALVNKEG